MSFPKYAEAMHLLYSLPILIALFVVFSCDPGAHEQSRNKIKLTLRVVEFEGSAAHMTTVHEEVFDIVPQRSTDRLSGQETGPKDTPQMLLGFHFIQGPTPTGVASEIQIGENRITVRANTSYSTIYSLAESDGQYHIFYGGQLVRTLKSTTKDASIGEAIPILKIDMANRLYDMIEEESYRTMESQK